MLTAIVVTHNSMAVVAPCLAALGEVDRIVVVDNASTDGTVAEIGKMRSSVELVRLGRNVGLATATNLAIDLCKPSDVLLLNPDVEVCSGAVDALKAYSSRHPEAGIVAPVLLNVDGSVQDSARKFPSMAELVRRRTPFGSEPAASESVSNGRVDWVIGAAMLLRRDVLNVVGGMDHRFFLYHEDVDLCWRVWRAGWEVHQVPGVEVVHRHARSSRKIWDVRNKAVRHHWVSLGRLYLYHPSIAL